MFDHDQEFNIALGDLVKYVPAPIIGATGRLTDRAVVNLIGTVVRVSEYEKRGRVQVLWHGPGNGYRWVKPRNLKILNAKKG